MGLWFHESLCLKLQSMRDSGFFKVSFEEECPSKNQRPNRTFIGTVKLPEGFGNRKEINHISIPGAINLRTHLFAFLSTRFLPNYPSRLHNLSLGSSFPLVPTSPFPPLSRNQNNSPCLWQRKVVIIYGS